MKGKEEFIENYYDQCGREISLAMATMDSNQNWTITIVSAIIVGIILRGFQPDIWTWSLLIIGLALTIRYFVRSCLAYANLIRWNKIRNKINDLFLFTETDLKKIGKLKEVIATIKKYDVEWLLPLPKRKIISSNLKYGYYYAFISLSLMLIYNAYAVYEDTGFIGPKAMQIFAIGFLGLLVVLYEIRGFFDSPYFKYKPPESSTSQSNRKKIVLNKTLIAALFLFLIVLVGASLSAYTESETKLISTTAFNTHIGEYYFSDPLHFESGTLLDASWNNPDTAGVGITQYSNVANYNQSKNLIVIEFVNENKGSIETTITTPNYYSLFTTASPSTAKTTTITLIQYKSPLAQLGFSISAIALGLLCLMVINYARNQNKK